MSKYEEFGARIPEDMRTLMVYGPQPEPWELFLHPPDLLPTPNRKIAYFTMWESTRLPPCGVDCLSKAEAVIVPTGWQASCFSANGVKVPIFVVPLGVNTDVFRWMSPCDYFKADGSLAPVVFGTAGRMAHGGIRKGINHVIEDFLRAFPTERDVRLRVKVYPDCCVSKINDDRVEIIRAHLSEMELRDWFFSLTCFVSAARGEGWGLMQQQAMAVGRPVMAMRFAGLSAFMTEQNSFCVPYRLAQAQKTYVNCGCWAEPDPEGFVESMRFVYEHPEEALKRGAIAAFDVAHLSWDNSNRKLAQVLEKIGAFRRD